MALPNCESANHNSHNLRNSWHREITSLVVTGNHINIGSTYRLDLSLSLAQSRFTEVQQHKVYMTYLEEIQSD